VVLAINEKIKARKREREREKQKITREY